jgi:hypothetical protein
MSPVVLAILVAVGESRSPVVTTVDQAASDVVGAGAVKIVEVAMLSDAEALRVESALATRATVQLEWRDPAKQNAHLRLHAARTDRWIDRDIAFAAEDTPVERGRTLGFAIASMLPEGDPSLRFELRDEPAPPPPPPSRNAAALAATATAGLGGPASGWGGVATVERFFGDSTSLDVSVAGRLGRIAELGARELTTSAGVGGAWWPVAPTASRSWGVALRVEALLLYHAVSHARAGGAVQWKGDLLPGADLKVEGTYRLVPAFEVVAGVGAEVAFGTIDVTVTPPPAGDGLATIPSLRALAALGIRARF